jgi:hypothetical protein
MDSLRGYSDPAKLSPVQCGRLFSNVAKDYVRMTTKLLYSREKNHVMQEYCWLLLLVTIVFAIFKFVVLKVPRLTTMDQEIDDDKNVEEVEVFDVGHGEDLITFRINVKSRLYRKLTQAMEEDYDIAM